MDRDCVGEVWAVSELRYRPLAERGALDLDECCIVPGRKGDARGWLLVFYVRTTDGHEQTFRVPVNPGGPHIEDGPLGRTWGLQHAAPGTWQVEPSIDLGNWHKTPKIVGVPDGEPWAVTP